MLTNTTFDFNDVLNVENDNKVVNECYEPYCKVLPKSYSLIISQ